MLAKNLSAPRGLRLPVSSLTIIASRLAPTRECGQTSNPVGCQGVHIHFCGNGHLWFRFYSDSLFQTPECRPSKKEAKGFAPPLGASLGLGMPSLRHCSVGRRDGPSLAQRG
ncbi:hypothetical protein SAMN04490206_1477 [Pseudomonas umsongensis]|nr:hypothetical protein SAMN04490206_1477 [Pseudomonas umsongensis]